VATVLKRISERQKKHHFFLESGTAKNKTTNRSFSIRKVAATWILNDYTSLLDEKAEARM
jgi:hypothetical protein